MEAETSKILDRVSNSFDQTNFVELGSDISVRHCASLVQEILYHMDKVKPYSNFKDVFYMIKLKELKANRTKFDRGEISQADYNRINSKIEAQYNHDTAQSQDLLDEKADRLMVLCNTLGQNVDALRKSARVRGEGLNDERKEKIMRFANDPAWKDFSSQNREGEKIRKALTLASNDMGSRLIPQLENLFSPFSPHDGKIFNEDLVLKLKSKVTGS